MPHRGGDQAGLVAFLDTQVRGRRGPASEVLDDELGLDAVAGKIAVGCTHGLPQGDTPWSALLGLTDHPLRPAQGWCRLGPVAVALSGSFTSGSRLQAELLADGALFRSRLPEELLLHLVARSSQRTVVNRVVDALWRAEGAYAAVVAAGDSLVGVRDARGIRPLVMGEIDGATVFASEDVAIRQMGGHVLRDVGPGEMVIVSGGRVQSVSPFPTKERHGCIQEHLQLGRLGATVEGRATYPIRRALGAQLAHEHEVSGADVVVAAADAAVAQAMGFAEVVGVPYARAAYREAGELVVLPEAVAGRRVALIAHGMLSGEDLRSVIQALLRAGAGDVHLRLTGPAALAACPYGVSGPSSDELALPRHESREALTRWMGAATIASLSLERVLGVVSADGDGTGVCTGCLSGSFPLAPDATDGQLDMFKG